MKNVRFQFSESKAVNIDVSWLTKLLNRDWSALHRLLKLLSFSSLVVLFVGLSFMGIEGVRLESTLFYSLLLVVATLVATAAGYLVLAGIKQFRDVAQLMLVLVYAFIAISTYLMVPASQENTFGVIGLLYASGLAVISLLGFFYLTAINLDTQRKLNWLVRSLILGIAISAITVFFVDIASWQSIFGRVFILALPTFLLSVILQGGKIWKLVLSVLTIVGLFSIAIYAGWHLWLVTLVTSLVMILAVYVQREQGLKGVITEIKQSVVEIYQSRLGKLEAAKNLYLPILLIVLVISAAGLLVSLNNTGTNLTSIANAHIGDLENLTTSQSASEIFFGEGADFNSVITLSSTILTIYSFQGLLGVFAYTLLALGGIILATRHIAKAVNSNFTNKVQSFVLSGILIATPLLGIVFRLTFLEVLVWWFVFTLVAASNNVGNWTAKYNIWGKLKLFKRDFSKFVPWLQLLLLIAIVVGWYLLVKQVEIALNSGLI